MAETYDEELEAITNQNAMNKNVAPDSYITQNTADSRMKKGIEEISNE